MALEAKRKNRREREIAVSGSRRKTPGPGLLHVRPLREGIVDYGVTRKMPHRPLLIMA